MPLNRNASRDSLAETYAAMRIVTRAQYDGVTLDDYATVVEVADGE